MIETKVKTVTTKQHTLKLLPCDILSILKTCGYAVPPDAVVYINVPSGGDWSGCGLPIDKDIPLEASWTTTEEIETDE